MPRHAWVVPIAGAVVVPLVTWLPMLAIHHPGLGLPPYPGALGIDWWQASGLWLTLILLVAAFAWPVDRWLAAAVGFAGVMLFFQGARIPPAHSMTFAMGALAFVAMRWTPLEYGPLIRTVLVGLGFFQVVYVIQQALFNYDFLWAGLWRATPLATMQPLGTLGTVDAASAYIAITAPLMPAWALPIAAVAVLASKSYGAILALTLGLAFRFGKSKQTAAIVLACALALPLVIHAKGAKMESAVLRVEAWKTGAVDFVHSPPHVIALGRGLSTWWPRVGDLQRAEHAPLIFKEAHNEYLQWVYETGLVGLVLLAGWLWSHRRIVRHPVWGGSVVACAVVSGSFFVFHVVATALISLVVVALASQDVCDQSPSSTLKEARS